MDSPEALAVRSVADCTSGFLGGTSGKVWRFGSGSPGNGKGEVLSGYLLHESRDGALSSTMRGTIAALLIAEAKGPNPRISGSDSQATCQECGESWVRIFPGSPGVARSGETKVGGTKWKTLGGSHVSVVVCFPQGW